MIDDSGLLEEFVTESKEHLATIEDEFLELESQGANADTDLVNTIFRAIHSIKGAAGFLGLDNVQNLAHVMENLLDKMRNKEVVPGSENVSALLAGSDLLSSMIDDVAHSNAVDISEIYDRVNSYMAGGTPPAADPDPAQPETIATAAENSDDILPIEMVDDDGAIVDLIPEPEKWRCLPPEYTHLYFIRYDLTGQEISSGREASSAVDELDLTGSVLASRVAAPEIDLHQGVPSTPLVCEMLYATVFDPGVVAAALSIEDKDVRSVYVSKSAAASRKNVDIEDIAEVIPEPLEVAVAPVAATAAPVSETPLPPAANSAPPAKKPQAAKQVFKDKSENSPKAGSETGSISVRKNDTIRLNVERIDRLMALAGELVLVRNRAMMMSEEAGGQGRQMLQQLDIVTTQMQEAIMGVRMQPIGAAFAKLPRIVRDLAKKLGKKIELVTIGKEVEVDKSILEAIADPLVHLTRNSCDHGVDTIEERLAAGKLETGTITVEARHEGGQIVISISDDGRGINVPKVKQLALDRGLKTVEELEEMSDKDAFSLIMMAGFSTAEQVTDVSGRGVGMDVVKECILGLGGTIEVDSEKGKCTIFTMRLPLTLAIIPSLVVRSNEDRFAIPQTNLEEIVRLYDEDVVNKVEYANNQAVYRLRNEILPLVYLDEILHSSETYSVERLAELAIARRERDPGKRLTFVVVRIGENRFGLVITDVVGSEEIVVKPMHKSLKALHCYAGSTVMGDGKVALILDINGVAEHAKVDFAHIERDSDAEEKSTNETHSELIFTVDNDERFAIATGLIKRIVTVKKEEIEQVADKQFLNLENDIVRIVRLDEFLNVSGYDDRDEYFLILPRHVDFPCGILATELLDVEQCDFDPHSSGQEEDGLMGKAVVRDRITNFIDLFRLAELVEPDRAKKKEEALEDMVPSKILLLEDTPFFKNLVSGYIAGAGYEVIEAENGQEGLEQLEQHADSITAIVSDIEMPIMDGFSFIQKVRTHSEYSGLPAMALTSLHSEEAEQRAYDSGFDKFQTKLDREKLIAAVHSMVQQQVGKA